MNGLSLNFKSNKFEKQFNKDITKQGKQFSHGYLIFISIELIIIGVDYAINRHQKDLVVFGMTAAQLILCLFQRFIVLAWSPNHFNLIACIQNLGQALLNCLSIHLWIEDKDLHYINNLSYGANIILKHVYLLQGSNFLMKFVTALLLSVVYLGFFLNVNSDLRHLMSSFLITVIMHIYKIFQEDLSLRNLFLVQRSEDEMNFLVKRLLPVSMLITRYDKKEERIYFHMSNTKVQKQFQIKDDDSMKNFFLKVELQALDDYQRIMLEKNNYTSLFQHLHLQAKSYSKKQQKKNKSNGLSQIDFSNMEKGQPILQPNNSITNQQQAYFSSAALNLKEDPISAGSPSHRQSDDLLSNRNQTEQNIIFSKNGGFESDAITQKRIRTIRKKEHKRTIIKQFDNLALECGEKQFEQTIREMYNISANHNFNFTQNNQSKSMFQTNGNNMKDLSDEIYDRLEVFYGILQGDNQRILNIKIYTYILEEIYQVIIFEDETLQGKVEYLQKLNKYYVSLFEQMLKKLRVPIAQSLYKMKKAVNNLRQTSILPKQQHSFMQLLSHQESINYADSQANPFQRIREIASEINFRKSSTNNNQINTSTNKENSLQNTSQIDNMFKQEQQNKEAIVIHAQDLQYSNYFILNNMFNYQDIFRIFQKNQIIITPINISLERVIKDLKTIFQQEYKSRQLDLYFINDLKEEESYINTDEKYLKQVFINLINNSLQALTKTQKGYTAVHLKNCTYNDQIIDISIFDTGQGFSDEYKLSDQIVIQTLNILNLEKNLNVKDLKIGIPISQKIVGKLGPYEKIKFEKNTVKFQIYRDYQGLIKNKDLQEGYVQKKSLFIRSRSNYSDEGSEHVYEDQDIDFEQNQINYAIQKQQIIDRNEMIVFGRHSHYFNELPY